MQEANEYLKIVTKSDLPDSFYSSRRLSSSLDTVSGIVEQVRLHGDQAVHEYASRFDKADPDTFELPAEALKDAEIKLQHEAPELYSALVRSRDLALTFAVRQKESFSDFETMLSPGMVTGQRIIPVQRAGVYVPAGRFPLFSSVIMGSAPAQAAGVEEIILCTPPIQHPGGGQSGNSQSGGQSGDGRPWGDEKILAVASLCGINRVFAIGGAQAIAAMAYGTESVPAVNVIVGPGNRFVSAAKKLVYGDVGIDMLAGPTEVMIIADASAQPAWVAADLLAQAEHDPDAQAVLLVSDSGLAQRVQAEINTLVSSLPPDAAARTSLSRNSYIILIDSWDDAVEIANRKAPEHLELALDAGEIRDMLEKRLRNYGSLFIGHRSAEILGDYTAGLNHTLPTCGSASFTGGLSVRHFLKTVTTLRSCSDLSGSDADISGWKASLRAAEIIARAEGLEGHALAARCRLD